MHSELQTSKQQLLAKACKSAEQPNLPKPRKNLRDVLEAKRTQRVRFVEEASNPCGHAVF